MTFKLVTLPFRPTSRLIFIATFANEMDVVCGRMIPWPLVKSITSQVI